MTSLCQVLDRLRSAKLTVKPSKCLIGYGSIECLDHYIVDQTVRPQEDKIHAIRDATRPKLMSNEVISWVGFDRSNKKDSPN